MVRCTYIERGILCWLFFVLLFIFHSSIKIKTNFIAARFLTNTFNSPFPCIKQQTFRQIKFYSMKVKWITYILIDFNNENCNRNAETLSTDHPNAFKSNAIVSELSFEFRSVSIDFGLCQNKNKNSNWNI